MSELGPVAIDADALARAVAELTAAIATAAPDGVTLLPLLPEGARFCCDLVAGLNERGIAVDVDPIRVTRLSAGRSGASLERSIGIPLLERDVLVVAAVIDTGMRLRFALSHLVRESPRTLAVCALLDRPDRRLVDLPLAHVGFTVPDCLFAGYGLGREVAIAHEADLHYLDAATAERAHRRHLAIV